MYNSYNKVKVIQQNQGICRTIIETKSIMLMSMFQMENHLSIEKIRRKPERSPQPQNPGDIDQPAQQPVPAKSLFHSNIFAIFGTLLVYL